MPEEPTEEAGPVSPESAKPIPAPGRERRREPRVSGHELVTAHWTDHDDRTHSGRARIVDRSKKGLGLQLAVPIPVGTEVSLRGGTTGRALVRHCRLQGDTYVLGLLRLAADRRDGPRMPVQGTGRLIWHNSESDRQDIEVRVHDSSSEGLQIESANEIPVPVIVRLVGKGIQLIAETRYCVPRGDHFVVGLRYVKFPERPQHE